MIFRNNKGQFIKGSHYRDRKSFWDRDFMYNLYVNQKKSSKEIAEMFGITAAAVQYWLRKQNIKRRNTSEVRKLKHLGSSGVDNPMYGKYGQKNPNYKGGVTPIRQTIYSRIPWKEIAKKVKERANGHCERCGMSNNRLHIHHIKPLKNGNEIVCHIDDLIVLCPKCHGFIHSKKNTEKELLK